MQDPAKGLRSVPLGGKKPNVVVGLDDGTVVVGPNDWAPLQVWNLDAGKLVREFEGSGQVCSMANLSCGRIAAGWHNGSQCVVAVFDAATGRQLQELAGFGDPIFGLSLVEDHLLTFSYDKTLRVWSQDPAGKVRRQCACPRGKGRGESSGEGDVCAFPVVGTSHLESFVFPLIAAPFLDPTLPSSKVH